MSLQPIDIARSLAHFYADSGVDNLILDEPVDHTVQKEVLLSPNLQPSATSSAQAAAAIPVASQTASIATPEAIKEAIKRAIEADSLEALASTIQEFDGLSLKHMATQMVFSDGEPSADIMVIGEAPGADEDRLGKPFMGQAGQLLDKMLVAIDLSRSPDEQQKPAYISNVLNWRPPGNRTPTQQEIDISLPFIEKHIILAKPKILLLMGSVAGKSLLGSTQGITKLRGKWHDYEIQTKALETALPHDIKVMATYHPSFLMKQPAQKKQAWHDLLMVKQSLANL